MTPTRCAECVQKDSSEHVPKYVPVYVPEDASKYVPEDVPEYASEYASEYVPEDASEVNVGVTAHSNMPQTNSPCGETR